MRQPMARLSAFPTPSFLSHCEGAWVHVCRHLGWHTHALAPPNAHALPALGWSARTSKAGLALLGREFQSPRYLESDVKVGVGLRHVV